MTDLKLITADEARYMFEWWDNDHFASCRVKQDWGDLYASAPDLAHTVITQAEQIKQLQARVGRVRKALLDEGRHPPYHRRQVERLRQEWPTLYNAIMELVKP